MDETTTMRLTYRATTDDLDRELMTLLTSGNGKCVVCFDADPTETAVMSTPTFDSLAGGDCWTALEPDDCIEVPRSAVDDAVDMLEGAN